MARTKGAWNKHTFQVEELAQKYSKEPFEILLMIAHGDWKGLGYEKPTRTSFTAAGIEFEEDIIQVKDRVSAASKACGYLYTAKHVIKLSNDPVKDALDVTPEKRSLEQLKALKAAGDKELEAIEKRISELETKKIDE